MYFCDECKEHCSPKVEDDGIGPYEFWGAKGTDHDYVLRSNCCEASVLDSNGDMVSASEYEQDREDDRADYELDCAKDREFDAQWEKQFNCLNCD